MIQCRASTRGEDCPHFLKNLSHIKCPMVDVQYKLYSRYFSIHTSSQNFINPPPPSPKNFTSQCQLCNVVIRGFGEGILNLYFSRLLQQDQFFKAKFKAFSRSQCQNSKLKVFQVNANKEWHTVAAYSGSIPG